MKKIIQFILKLIAKLYLKKFNPKIIAITGSVGKTSTKEAVFAALKDYIKTRASQKSYNNEIGVPLTIIGHKSPAKNVFLWFKLFVLSLIRYFFIKDYPKVLVLEMGSDKPGDLKRLISIAKPNISIITKIGPAHFYAFESWEKLLKEKTTIVRILRKDEWALLNKDDFRLEKVGKNLKCKVMFYGIKKDCELTAKDINFKDDGVYFSVVYKDKRYQMKILGGGEHLIYSILAGFGAGVILGIEPEKIIKSLDGFKPLPGRGRILKGNKDFLIIDETYNSNPASLKAALNFLKNRKWDGRKVAIIGDMKELGSLSRKYHLRLAKWLDFVDFCVLVGEETYITFKKMNSIHNKGKVLHYDTSEELAKDIRKIILPKDLVLFKASQAIRLEKAIAPIIFPLYNPKKVLVRQEDEWK